MFSKFLSQVLCNSTKSPKYIMINNSKNIISIFALEMLFLSALNNRYVVIPIIPIPINTLIDELKLCFTTSVSFLASIFGYFKFMIIPIVSDISGSKIDDINISIIFTKSNLNFINIIMSPINMNGNINDRAAFTFDFMISYGFIGKLFNMLNDFPSRDVIELVIYVIKLVKQMNPNIMTGM